MKELVDSRNVTEHGLDNSTLIEIFALRASGVPIFYLAQRAQRDRHTVRTYLNNHNIPLLSLDLRKPKSKKVKYLYIQEEPICAGKSYREYVQDSLQRSWERKLRQAGL